MMYFIHKEFQKGMYKSKVVQQPFFSISVCVYVFKSLSFTSLCHGFYKLEKLRSCVIN